MQQFRHKTSNQSFKDASAPIWIQQTWKPQKNNMVRYDVSACRIFNAGIAAKIAGGGELAGSRVLESILLDEIRVSQFNTLAHSKSPVSFSLPLAQSSKQP